MTFSGRDGFLSGRVVLRFTPSLRSLGNLLQDLPKDKLQPTQGKRSPHRRKVDGISRGLLVLQLCLSAELSDGNWGLIDRITFEEASHVQVMTKPDNVAGFRSYTP